MLYFVLLLYVGFWNPSLSWYDFRSPVDCMLMLNTSSVPLASLMVLSFSCPLLFKMCIGFVTLTLHTLSKVILLVMTSEQSCVCVCL